jgi:phosphomannomutase
MARLAPKLKTLGVETFAAESGRQAIHHAVRCHRPDVAADEHGRIWFPGAPICADALKVLTLLLTILSRSDRPLSERIASAIL